MKGERERKRWSRGCDSIALRPLSSWIPVGTESIALGERGRREEGERA